MAQIRKKYGKLKKVQEYEKQLYIPITPTVNKYCLFYSRFECGNLHRVVERNIGSNSLEYDLYLQYDTNSADGLMHWYYFQIATK